MAIFGYLCRLSMVFGGVIQQSNSPNWGPSPILQCHQLTWLDSFWPRESGVPEEMKGWKNLGENKIEVFSSYVTLQEKHISPWGNGKLHLQKVATGRGGLLVPRMIYCRIISFYLNLTSEGISTILQTCIVQQGFIVCQPPISGPIAGHLEWGDPAMTPPPYPRTIINLANT